MRKYSSTSGRWMNRDRLGEDTVKYLYAFCGNSSIASYDILGLNKSDSIIVDIEAEAWSFEENFYRFEKRSFGVYVYLLQNAENTVRFLFRMFPHIGYPPDVDPPVPPPARKGLDDPVDIIGTISGFPLENTTGLSAEDLFGKPEKKGADTALSGFSWPRYRYPNARFSIIREWSHRDSKDELIMVGIEDELFTHWQTYFHGVSDDSGSVFFDLKCGEKLDLKMGNSVNPEFTTSITVRSGKLMKLLILYQIQ